MSDPTNRPAETLRDGNLKATIWENSHEDRVTHTVQFRRSYRGSDGQMRETDSFFGNGLLRIANLASESYKSIRDLREKDRNQSQEGAPRRSRSRDQDRAR